MSTAPLEDVLSTTLHLTPGHCLVRLHGELDGLSCGQVPAALEKALGEVPVEIPVEVLLDLHDVTFCDLDGLRALESARRLAASRGVRLRCAGSSPLLRRVAPLVGFGQLLASGG